MGVDARWVCHTCKTMCFADGARSILVHGVSVADLEAFLILAPKITKGHYISGWDTLLGTARDHLRWRKRHEGHKIYITNDSSVSRSDFPDYRAETVGGKVSKETFGEDLDAEARYYSENTCPRCGSFIGDREDREEILGIKVSEGGP